MDGNPRQDKERSTVYPMVYAWLLPRLRDAAREHGYALAAHGSMARDLDLIACPWTDEAADAETLIEALRAAVGGTVWPGFDAPNRVTPKPHGRLAYSIYFAPECFGPYLDVSVMPRQHSE